MKKLLTILIVLLIAASATAQPKGVNLLEFRTIDEIADYEIDDIDEMYVSRGNNTYVILWDVSPVAIRESLEKLIEILDANDAVRPCDNDDSLLSPRVDDVYTEYTMLAATCKIKESVVYKYWYIKKWTICWSIDDNYAGIIIFKDSFKTNAL